MEALNTTLWKGYTVELHLDESAESPRLNDNLGTMVCWHAHYELGDNHEFQSPKDAMEHILKTGAVWLPLYLYDHSGITMNTTGFSCQWDSGQVGYIFVERDKVLKEYHGRALTRALRAKVEGVLKAEVATYDQYLRGAVYGYVVKKDGKVLESCWGYYGDQAYVLADAKRVVDDLAAEVLKKRLKRVKAMVKHHVPLDARVAVA